MVTKALHCVLRTHEDEVEVLQEFALPTEAQFKSISGDRRACRWCMGANHLAVHQALDVIRGGVVAGWRRHV